MKPLLICLVISLFAFAQSPAPFVPNYDEAKVGKYTLPDPLTMNDGSKIKTAQQWRKRRAELLQLFAENVYGRTPATKSKLRFEEKARDANALGGLATRREITIHLTPKTDGPKMNLMLYIPNKKQRRVPAFLAMNYGAITRCMLIQKLRSQPRGCVTTKTMASSTIARQKNHAAPKRVAGQLK